MPSYLLSSGSGELSGLAGWAVDVVAAMGAVGVGLLVMLETIFPPVPSEVVLPVAGFAASQDQFSLTSALIASTGGSVGGALVLYFAGARLGAERLQRLADRIPLMGGDDVTRAQDWFDRHGWTTVLIGRLVPGVRSFVSIPAGVQRMSLLQFVALTAIGSGAYNAVLILIGHELGRHWTTIGTCSDAINYAIFTALGLTVLWFVVRRMRRRASD